MKVVYNEGNSDELKNVADLWIEQHKKDNILLIVDAAEGYRNNMSALRTFEKVQTKYSKVVITNQVLVLDEVMPNAEQPYYDFYFVNSSYHCVRLNSFYPNIRVSQNPGKMYRGHVFTADIERG